MLAAGAFVVWQSSYSRNPKFKGGPKLLICGYAIILFAGVQLIFSLIAAESNIPPESAEKIRTRLVKEGKLSNIDEEFTSARGFKVKIPSGYRSISVPNNPNVFLIATGPNQETFVIGSSIAAPSDREMLEAVKKEWRIRNPKTILGTDTVSALPYDRQIGVVQFNFASGSNEFAGTVAVVRIERRALTLTLIGPASLSKFNEPIFAKLVASFQPQYIVQLD